MAKRLAAGAAILAHAPVLAQANADAVAQADDAFGFTSGDESVGIYDESSVRGFDLEAAGNYRFDGNYFVKSSGVSSFFVESTTVRIGYNTLRTLFPGPSGVVDFRLRDPAPGEPSLATTGLNEYEQPYLDLLLKGGSSEGRASGALGLGLVFDRKDAQGGSGHSWLVAGTGRVDIGEEGRLRAFFGEYDYVRSGRFRILPGSELPRRIERRHYLGQDWAIERGQRRIAGLLADAGRDGWIAGANAVFSQEDPTRAYSQLFFDLDHEGNARALVVAAPQQRFTALSGEARGGWTGRTGDLGHRIVAIVRGRRSRGRFGGEELVDLGSGLFGERPARAPTPDLSDNVANLTDRVEQWSTGLAYQLAWADRLRLNSGLLWTDYHKEFRAADGSRTTSGRRLWLYNVGLGASLTKGLELYASYARGLEDAGIAPASAANRNAVLDASVAKQRELGLRYQMNGDVSLILAGFDTRKPYAGSDPATREFRHIGAVRHRGVEFSASGTLLPRTKAVLGGVLIEPRLSGPSVDAGLLGRRPVGVPKIRLIAGATHELALLSGWSIDAGATYEGRQPAGSVVQGDGRQLSVSASFVLDLGMRYRFKVAGHALALRAQVLNLFNDYSWDVNGAETLDYSAPRRFRVALTAEF